MLKKQLNVMIAHVDATDLPTSVSQIMDYIGRMAASYGHMKWNERDKLKADMMNVPERWYSVSADALTAKCREVGLSDDDTAEILDFLVRRKQGRRLVPSRGYRTFKFGYPVEG